MITNDGFAVKVVVRVPSETHPSGYADRIYAVRFKYDPSTVMRRTVEILDDLEEEDMLVDFNDDLWTDQP